MAEPISNRLRRWWPIAALPIVFAIVIVGVYALSSLSRANQLVRHTDDVRIALWRLQSTLVDAETGARGYAVTGDPVFLEPYLHAQSTWRQEFEQVRALTSDDPEEQRRIAQLEPLIGERIDFLTQLRTARAEQRTGAELTPNMLEGKRAMDQIRSVIAQMNAAEDRLEAARVQQSLHQWRRAMIIFVGSTVGLTFVLLAIWLQRRESEARRVRAEERARASELFRIVLDGVDVGITVQDPVGHLVYVNDAAAGILGFDSAQALVETPPKQVSGRYEMFHGDGTPFATDQIPTRRALAGQSTDEITLRFKTRGSREERWSRVRAVPALDGGGKVVYAITFFREVTAEVLEKERRVFLLRAVDELSTSLDLRQTLSTVAELAVPVLADWCAIDLVEDGARRRVGIAHVDPTKIALLEEMERRYPSDPNARAGIPEILRTGKPELFPEISEEQLVSRAVDEEHRKMLASLEIGSYIGVPLRARGQVFGVLSIAMGGSGRHYTERDLELAVSLADRAALAIDNARLLQQTERARDRSESIFRLMVESVKDYAIFMLNPEGVITTWNRGAELIKGYRADEIIGRHFSTFYPPDVAATGKCELELEIARREGRFQEEGWRVRKDGSLFWANVTITAITDEKGELRAFGKVTRDLTERKRAEERLAEEAQKRADAEAQSKFADAFIGILGHDLRNPLNAISMSAQLMKRRSTGESPQAIDRILSSSDRMANMVMQLLDLTRIRLAGGITLEKSSTDLHAVVGNAVDELRLVHPRREIQLEIENEARGFWDRNRLAQAISNLVGNACEHGDPARPISVRLSTSGGDAIFAVHSFGPHIPQEMIPVIFDPYRRVAQKGPRPKGLGLGLFITRQIVEAHGGRIDCRSHETEGTTFNVRLPVVAEDKASTAPMAPA
jgi:PAS domain S-box-containing protein